MRVQRPTTEPKSPPKPPTTVEGDEDVEGHFMTQPTYVAIELARARQREIKKGAARYPLIAEARERARAKR